MYSALAVWKPPLASALSVSDAPSGFVSEAAEGGEASPDSTIPDPSAIEGAEQFQYGHALRRNAEYIAIARTGWSFGTCNIAGLCE